MALEIDFVRGLVRGGIPHLHELGVDVETVDASGLTISLGYQERLVGNPETGVLHGGVITVLLDTASGLAVWSAVAKPVPIATLDLRIDYLKPASPGQKLYARADCFKLTRNVAFTRALAYHVADDPIAQGIGSFMLSAPGRPPALRG